MILNSLAKDISSYDNNILYSELPTNKVKSFNFWSGDFKKHNFWVKEEELNSLNFRSEEFIYEHKGMNIIFTGCSQTFGTGLLQEELWTFKLYNLIKENNKVSGYFNLATPGASIGHCVANLFKYFKKYGNPNVVFFNMPNTCRTYHYNKKEMALHDGRFSDEHIDLFNVLSYQYYLMLELYCKTNNIKLFVFSWHENTNLLMRNNFKNFIFISEQEISSFIVNKYKNLKNATVARDNEHLGTGFHEYWTERIYNEFMQ
jgi:hypothetical protein